MIKGATLCIILFASHSFGLIEIPTEELAIRSQRQQQKLWWKYMEKLLSACITKRFITITYCGNQISRGARYFCSKGTKIKIKMFYRARRISRVLFQSCLSNRGLNIINFLRFIITRVMTWHVLGKRFQSRYLGSFLSKTTVRELMYARNVYNSGYQGAIERYFLFYLSNYLRLNATFHHILFSQKNLFSCSLGHLKVSSSCRKDRENVIFTYCGSVSRFTNYFPEHSVCLVVSNERNTRCNITFSLSIMDKGLVKSISLKQTMLHLKSGVFFPSSQQIVYMFHIHVAKCDRIVVESVDFDHVTVVFHDGPGKYSPVITKSSDMYRTSTFQFVVFVWTLHSLGDSKRNQMKYRVHEQDGHNVSLDVEQLYIVEYYSGEASASLFLVYLVKAPAKYHINVTAHTIKENYLHSPFCLFGGLSVFDKFQTTN